MLQKAKIKEGFIKATELTNIKDGIVEASVITLNRGNFTSPVGEEVEIGAQLYPQYSNEQIEWTSSDDKIASVENGKVTINGVGTATITAKIKSNSKSIAVTGVSADSEFKFDGDEYSLNINNSLDLSKKLGGKESGEITWSSSDGNVVSVSGGKG
ncbi:MAG: Ig-like domain-containing protein [Anaerotruncus sp.]|nr:MAG: Ig-like domain-containing protein [Anaerotruncus sp.]